MGDGLEPIVNLNVTVLPAREWPADLRAQPLGEFLYERLVTSGFLGSLQGKAAAKLGGEIIVYENGTVGRGQVPGLLVINGKLDLNDVRATTAHIHETPIGMIRFELLYHAGSLYTAELGAFDTQQLRAYASQNQQ